MKNRVWVFSAMALALLTTAACGISGQSSAAQPPAVENQAAQTTPMPAATKAPAAAVQLISIQNFAFNPKTLTIPAGTTVKWTNMDSAEHNVMADDGSFKSDTLAQGASFSFTFTKPGTYTYKCGFHANMTATIIVQ